MEIVELKNGHKVGVAIAPFRPANALRKALAAEMATVTIDIDIAKLSLDMDISKLDAKGLNTIKNVFCKLLSSDVIEKAMFDCAASCTLEGKKVTPDLFNDEELRADFIPVAQEVIKANVPLFFENLDLKSLISAAPKSDGPPSG